MEIQLKSVFHTGVMARMKLQQRWLPC